MSVALQNINVGEGTKVQVLAEGRLLPARLTPSTQTQEASLLFTAHGTLTGDAYAPPKLTLRILRGCGPREYPLGLVDPPSADAVRRRLQAGETLGAYASMPSLPGSLAQLYVDNRKGKAGVLELGSIPFSYPAGKFSMHEIDACDAPTPVKWDGAAIGEIPAISTSTGWPQTIVVDPTGRRCYAEQQVWYGAEGGGSSKPDLLSGRKVYFFPHVIAHFFEDPPSERWALNGETPTAHVFKDAACRKPRAGP